MRYAYVNGQIMPHQYAKVSVEDRGYQFADGIYEVVAWLKGRPLDMEPHLDRLVRSADELSLKLPISRAVLTAKIHQMVRLNRLKEGLVYMQLTRGVAPRNHAYPPANVRASLVITTTNKKIGEVDKFKAGFHVISLPDLRWKRCDIKTLNLLPNCMAKQQAASQNADEAWLVNEKGEVSEGTSSNAWIINQKNQLITHPLTFGKILAGITRKTLLASIEETGLMLVERPFTLNEAYGAKEAFISSASSLIMPVLKLDEHFIHDGKVGEFTIQLYRLYHQRLIKA